ncbi:hypothetical protein [Yoonia sediminilitoris]|nr:hypothetical protein [Yoonia sediminilitoris]
MTTNFALSLSMEGIQLLHRVTGGWKLVGDASIEDPRLDDVLADLRNKAMALEPTGMRTKLVIPLDQIKYLALDTTQTTQEEIEAAIDGTTPYALDELVIDSERRGGRTHIAAVAKETLDEAEAFARAHRFNPVCFVAIPEPFTFQSEVFFGPTRMMTEVLGANGEVTRDVLPIMIAGTRIKSRLLIFDIPDDELPAADGHDLATLLGPSAADEAPDEGTNAQEPARADDPEPQAAAPEVDSAPVEPEPATTGEQLVFAEVDAPAETAPKATDGGEEEAQEPETAQFDEVVEEPAAIIADAVEPQEAPQTPPEPTEPQPKALPPNSPVFTIPVDPIIAEYHTARPKYQRRAKQRVVGSRTAVAPAAPPHYPDVESIAPVIVAPKAPVRNAAKPAPNRAKPVMVGTAVAASAALAGWLWMQSGEADTVPINPASEAAIPEQPTDTAAQLSNVPPDVPTEAPTLARSNPAPLAVSPGLPIFEDWISFAAYSAPPAFMLAAPDTPLSAPTAMPAPPPEATVATVGAPLLRGRVLSPDEAELIYQATGVWQRAPRILAAPETTTKDGVVWPEALPAPGKVAQPITLESKVLAPELDFLAPADPPPPTARFAVDEQGNIVATPEGAVTPEGAIVFAGLPDLTVRARPELSSETLAMMQALAPSPDGVEIIAGPPPVVPPVRPNDLAEANADLAPGAVGIAGLQGTEDTAEALLARPTDEPRPTARPAGLDTSLPPEALPSDPDIASVIAGIATEETASPFIDITRNAIAESRRPRTRPQNFSRVVTAALQRQRATAATPATPATPAPQAAAAPRSAPAASAAPRNGGAVPGGVARAATQEDAIQLGDINLIGVYGRANARRALVRLTNGRYVRVEIGSSLDGGQVTAIGDKALNYVKRGRTYAIQVPVN